MTSTLVCLLVPMALPLGVQADAPLVLTQDQPQVEAWAAITLKADSTYKLSAQDMLGRLDEFEALAPLDSDDPQGLTRLADAAMYAGKQGGKHSIRRNSSESALSS